MNQLTTLLWLAIAAIAQDTPVPTEDAAAPTEDAAATTEDPAAPTDEAEVAPDPPTTSVTYTLSAAQSWLYVVIYYDRGRWTPVKAHDHGIRATSFDGTVTWNVSDPSQCDVKISFPVTTLVVDPPGMREREGLPADGAIEEDTKQTVVGNMHGRKNLDKDKFPRISYASTSCDGTQGTVNVSGGLTIHGVTKNVTVPMQITVTPDSFRAKGTLEMTHADFGMSPFTYGPGTPKNEQRLKFVIDVTGSP